MKKILFTTFICLVLAGCASTQTPPKMPDMWLGDWMHWDGTMRLSVNPDGTMVDRYLKIKETDERHLYKVLDIADDGFVTFLKKRTDGRIFLSVFFVSNKTGPNASLGPVYRWGWSYGEATEKEWQNPMAYKQELLSRVPSDLRESLTDTEPMFRPRVSAFEKS